ncbi:MAG: hypothetical protein IJQ24_08265 [Synergistaceae bacterium]|nr:hypothetical protein [Synergistaceae bacterium]
MFCRKKKLSFDELIAKSLNVLAEQKFPSYVVFNIPKTKNIAKISVVKDAIDPGFFRLNIHAEREGSNLTIFHMRSKNTEAEIREELRKYADSQAEREAIRAEIMELSESVDDKEGEFPSDY